MFAKKTYIARRAKLKQTVGSGLLLFIGNDESGMNYADNTYHFRQDSTFLYFFGLPYAGLSAIIDIDNDKEIIFGDELTIDDIVWMGIQPTLKEKSEAAGIVEVRPSKDIEAYLKNAAQKKQTIHYLPSYRAEHQVKLFHWLGIVPGTEKPSLPFIMPATGVSGVDLYSINSDGKWNICYGGLSFGDTVKTTYKNIGKDRYHNEGFEYRLYLPLYNGVNWLRIGIQEGKKLTFIPASIEKPIVLYGTSIAQGACASRPGQAWSNILQRDIDYPVINLAFSGNGKLEPEVLNFINEIDSRLYILDCIPNLTEISADVVTSRVLAAVKQIRAKHSTPILLVEHVADTLCSNKGGKYRLYRVVELSRCTGQNRESGHWMVQPYRSGQCLSCRSGKETALRCQS